MTPLPLLWLSLAFVTGILLASLLTLPVSTWLALAAVSLALALILRRLQSSTRIPVKRNREFTTETRRSPSSLCGSQRYSVCSVSPWFIALNLLTICLGAARYQAALPDFTDPAFIAQYNDSDQTMTVTGVVIDFPDRRDRYTNLRIQAERIRLADDFRGQPAHGLLLARIAPEEEVHYGDRVVLRGRLLTPPEGETFSYRDYLAHQGIYAYMPHPRGFGVLAHRQGNPLLQAIYALKERALADVYRLWPDPEASLFAGILLGVESGIPASVKEAFKNTGTSHIIAISGFNITIIAALFVTVLNRLLNPRRAALTAVAGIALYTVLVGADAAVVRAAIMGSLSLFARQVGRRQHGINSLAFVAALMALLDPNVLWDVGFQLSFAATLGLVLYADPFQQAFIRLAARALPESRARRLAEPVGEYVLFTFAAQLTTFPVMAYHFGRISWSAFLVNPLILPAQPPVMTLGGAALLLALLWFPLGQSLAALAWPFLLYTIRVVEYFARWRGTLALGDFGLLWVFLFYGGLLGLTLGWSRRPKWLPALKPLPLIALLGVLTALTWRAALSAPDGRLHLTLLNVGSSETLLLQTPTGRYLLINGGDSLSLLSDGLGRRLPPFRRGFDWLIVANPDEEQIAALPDAIPRYPPQNVLWAGLPSPNRAADYLRQTLNEADIPITPALDGHTLDLGDGASLRLLTTGPRGAVLLLEWNRFRALLPIGLDEEAMQTLENGRAVGRVSALLLAGHGYAPLNPPQWIASLNPQVILLSVAADDPRGLPDAETLAALQGYTLLRTDRHGWIHLSTDGEHMWLEVERLRPVP